jgi:hypothetical protein
MSNKKKSKQPKLGGELHREDRKISREMKKLKQKNRWSNKK